MQDKKNSHRYDDIMHLPHPEPIKHSRMTRLNRAAQFSPFAALTGYEDAVKETARLTSRKIELNEDSIDKLNSQLCYIQEHISENIEVSITYFQPDKKKAGGVYLEAKGIVKKIDEYEKTLVFKDGNRIPLVDIVEIRCELLEEQT